jgi:hypothetical protein
MSDFPSDDRPGFVVEKPEFCFASHRVVLPGQTHYLTSKNIVHCEGCALSRSMSCVRDDPAIDVKRDRLLSKRGEAEIAVSPGELLHPASALPEAALRASGERAQEG